MGFVWLLVLLVVSPLIFMLVGIILAFHSDEGKRRKGRRFLIGGVLALLVEILIGYSVCSNMHFGGGMH